MTSQRELIACEATLPNEASKDASVLNDFVSREEIPQTGIPTDPAVVTVGELKVLYTNADQFVNKLDELRKVIAGDEPDVMLITEVIPKAQKNPMPQDRLSIPGYDIILNFDLQSNNLGGSGSRGVAIYVKDTFGASKVPFRGSDFIEHLLIELRLQGNAKLLVGCIYRSPSAKGRKGRQSMKSFRRLLGQVTERYSHFIICGDFNAPQIHWKRDVSTARRRSHYQHELLKIIKDNGLFQKVVKPTWLRKGARPSLLDLVITTEEEIVRNLVHLPPLGKSDHQILRFDYHSTPSLQYLEPTVSGTMEGDMDNQTGC